MSNFRDGSVGVATGWMSTADCDLASFRRLVEQETRAEDYPHAEGVESNLVVYGPGLAGRAGDGPARREVQAELARALGQGPGVVVFRQAFDSAVVGRATRIFEAMLAEQDQTGAAGGDHFAAPGSNGRLWGALDKLGTRDPEVFVDYYANDALALVAEAWLGPGYQVTSQVNVVRPGARAQSPHRDYHLGFMDRDRALAYPAQVHVLSALLTLQGAVAHVDMPARTGPTLYLPHSQKYLPGYIAHHDPGFAAYFEDHHVQLALSAGDAAFFNPAVIHAAGHNRSSDVMRMANLLQISSGFGRAMEAVDTTALCRAVFPVLARRRRDGAGQRALRNVVAAASEAYPFPTNLDRDSPVSGPTPPTQADLLWAALEGRWDANRLEEALAEHRRRRQASAS